MSKKKLRSVAKKIKGNAQFKKMLATFLTDVDLATRNYNIKEMLMVGNRGYLALSEMDLCDRFDAIADKLDKDELKQHAEDEPRYSWYTSFSFSDKVKALKETCEEIRIKVFEWVIFEDSK